MANVNCVFLMGNLTRDPELRYLPSGQPVATFTIAVNRVYMSQAGEKKEEVSFVRVVVWGKRAETCNQYLSKGSPVFVEGRLRSRSWEAQDGTKRSAIEVIARNVQFLGKMKGQQAAVTAPEETQAQSEAEREPDDIVDTQGKEEVPF
ncbi:MAG: single-stranded DNA-binding protein [Candidatus Omnitrophota bacterium]